MTANAFLLWACVVVCAAVILWGVRVKERIYSYPFWAALVFASFILVQFAGLLAEEQVPQSATSHALIMALLSLAMCFYGWIAGARSKILKRAWTINPVRLGQIGAVYVAIGGYFLFLISRMFPVQMGGGWSGVVVVFHFFGELRGVGFAVCLFVLLWTGSRTALLGTLVGLLLYLDSVVFGGRRTPGVELILFTILSLWFVRRVGVPRFAALAVPLVGVLLFYSIGEYRAVTVTHTSANPISNPLGRIANLRWNEVRAIDYLGNLKGVATAGGPEVRNAIHIIGAVNSSGNFDMGGSHWNNLIFRYVPSALVGGETKAALYLGGDWIRHPHDPLYREALQKYGYVPSPGSTVTGLADSYASFWFFGSLIFFLIAYSMRAMYDAAMDGSVGMGLMYVLCMLGALHAIPHHTGYYPARVIYVGIFLVPALMLARVAHPHGGSGNTRHVEPAREGGLLLATQRIAGR